MPDTNASIGSFGSIEQRAEIGDPRLDEDRVSLMLILQLPLHKVGGTVQW